LEKYEEEKRKNRWRRMERRRTRRINRRKKIEDGRGKVGVTEN
jgi:hypothetical protein